MKIFTLILALFELHALSYSQDKSFSARNNIDRFSSSGVTSGDFIFGFDLPPRSPQGSIYLQDSLWRIGSFKLVSSNHVYDSIPLRFNLLTNHLELKMSSGLRSVSSQKILYFEWSTERFLDGQNFQYFTFDKQLMPSEIKRGKISQILYQKDSVKILKIVELFLKPATYTPQLDVGSLDSKYVVKEHIWGLTNRRWVKLKPKVSSLVELLGFDKNHIQSVIANSGLTLETSADLVKVADFVLSHDH